MVTLGYQEKKVDHCYVQSVGQLIGIGKRLKNKYMKITKVFAGDTRLKDIYVGATKFEVFKFKALRLFRRVAIVIIAIDVIGWAGVAGYHYAKSNIAPEIVRASVVDVSDTRFNRKIEELKMSLVDELISCESPNHKDEDGLIIYDPQKGNTNPHKVASIGRLQFKVDTVIFYSKTLYNANLSRTEAVLLALDTPRAKVLARDILFKSRNKANDWLNCANKLDLNKKIDIIKSLEK